MERPGIRYWNKKATIIATQEILGAIEDCEPFSSIPLLAEKKFKQSYAEKLKNAGPAKWIIALGTNRAGRVGPILDALERGRITTETALKALPENKQDVLRIAARKAQLKQIAS